MQCEGEDKKKDASGVPARASTRKVLLFARMKRRERKQGEKGKRAREEFTTARSRGPYFWRRLQISSDLFIRRRPSVFYAFTVDLAALFEVTAYLVFFQARRVHLTGSRKIRPYLGPL